MAILGASSPEAQGLWDSLTNPHFAVRLTHPPQIALKGVQKVTVRQFTGTCGDELSERLLQAMATSGKFEIIDRANLDAILSEQGFQATTAVNAESAVKLGQLLGPTAMFTGNVTRCSVLTSEPLRVDGTFRDRNGRPATKYIRKTTGHMTASIRLIDFATGKVHSGRLIEANAERVNEAFNGTPEAPSKDDVETDLYHDAIGQTMRMIYPWTETVQIIVFDDDDTKKFVLKPSAEIMKHGNFTEAVQSLRAVIAQGGGPKIDDKARAKAQYDLGIALLYSEQTGEALTTLRGALALDPDNKTIQQGFATANRSAALEAEQQRLEASAVEFGKLPGAGAAASGTGPNSTSTAPAAALTNADILQLVKDKVPDAVIVLKIKSSPCKFDTSSAGLGALTKGGVSADVMAAMIEKK
jgi:hypothetical protein